jgi:hypothetical protein
MTATPTSGPNALYDAVCVATQAVESYPGTWTLPATNNLECQYVVISNASGKTAQIKWNKVCASTDADFLLPTGTSQQFTQAQLHLPTLKFVTVYLPADAVATGIYVHTR